MPEVKRMKYTDNDREEPVGVRGWPQERCATNTGLRHSSGATGAESTGVDLLLAHTNEEKKPRRFCPSFFSAGPEKQQGCMLATEGLGIHPPRDPNPEPGPSFTAMVPAKPDTLGLHVGCTRGHTACTRQVPGQRAGLNFIMRK